MKKRIVGGILVGIFPLLLSMILLIILIAGEEYSSEPVPLFATSEKAEEYQYVGSELGIPWELTLLADGLLAFEKDLDDIEDKNPLITAFEFCILVEQEYRNTGEDEEGNIKWEYVRSKEYKGTDEILRYIGAVRDDFSYTESSTVVSLFQDIAESKSSENLKFSVSLLTNPDYEWVLTEKIKLTLEDADAVMELYESHYIAYLYGYMTEKDDDLIADAEDHFNEVPVIEGNVTRQELARVAQSIMNWPYLLGAKSSVKGVPRSPLDCSGYVDWVYVQCFGKGVSASGGNLPSGVAISGTAIQFYSCKEISESELKVGDLGFLKHPKNVAPGAYNHVGIYIGEINGQHAFIHCGGSSFGTEERPKGRVGISVLSGTNNVNPVTGATFDPAMKSVRFQYFMRPNFKFIDDESEVEG